MGRSCIGSRNTTYSDQWESWRAFFGGPPSNRDKSKLFWPFEQAREYIRKLGLTENQWEEWRKTSRPDHIPSNPNRTYKTEWKGMADWLGLDRSEWGKTVFPRGWRVAVEGRTRLPDGYMSYEDASAMVRSCGIKTMSEFGKWRLTDRPKNFPSSPR